MLIELQQVERVYRKHLVNVAAIKQATLTIAEGEFTAIMGPSGSGKSTLLHILGCLDRPSTGTYYLDGIDVAQLNDGQLSYIRNQKIGFVFQSFNLLPQHTVLQNIEAPLLYATPMPPGPLLEKQSRREYRECRAQAVADQVRLGNRGHHRPHELSGGEMQRVAIARALVANPRVILADEPTGNLDSRTGQEIMDIFHALHDQGHTIIVVTHEKTVAEYADRVILLKDGEIERDTGNRQQAAFATSQTADSSLEAADGKRIVQHDSSGLNPDLTGFQNLSGLLLTGLTTAFRGVLLHKLRSLLSILGIVFGIGAIIAMLSIGAGAKQEILDQIELLGTNNILVKTTPPGADAILSGKEQLSQGVTSQDVERIAQVSPYIAALAAVRVFPAPVQYQRQVVQAQIVGTSSAYQYTGHLSLRQGRFLTAADERDMQRVCVLGAEIQQALFAFQVPLGQMVKIRNDWFRVIGTLENKVLQPKTISSIQMRNLNTTVYIPLATSAEFVPSKERELIQEIAIRVDKPAHIDEVAEIIRAVLTRVHYGAKDYEVIVPRELLKQSQQTQNVFNLVMGCIAGISLLVGGIGIMNIMLATVTERTKEIGIRRAIGASRRMILMQFLIETLLLTFVGGCLGVLLGIGGASVISLFAQWRTIISAPIVLLAFGISALIGIVFGMYPASQGANMDPIAALRYE